VDSVTGSLVTRPLAKATLGLALPSIASLFVQAAFSLVNIIWAGRLGAAPLAAVNTAAFIVWTVEALASLCSVGTNALVSRHVGAGERETARGIAGRALGVAAIVSAATAAAGFASLDALFAFMGTDAEVTELGRSYMMIFFAGSFTVFVWAAVEAVFRAWGDTRTPMKLLVWSLVANAVLDPLLMFGIGPFPRWGVAGASVATIACRLVASAVGLVLLYRRGLVEPGSFLRADGTSLRIVRIGLPIAISQASFCVVYMALTRVIAIFGTPAIAAVGIGHKSESVAYFVAVGFSFAAATMVGQNLGAGRPDRAARAAWVACGYTMIVATVVAVAMLAAPRAIARIFIDDPAVVEIAVRYLRIVAVSEFFLVFEFVLEGAFGGAGDTVPPLIVSGPLSIARVPAAYFLAVTLGWGIDGVWWAISLSSILKGALLAGWFAWKYGLGARGE
jgi:putative MATE family efflux protein